MTIIPRRGEAPVVACKYALYIMHRKRVVKNMKVYQLNRDGKNHNWYIDKEGYRVSSRTSEHAAFIPPQWTLNVTSDRCRDCGDWRHSRCGQNMQKPVCNICEQLHLDMERLRGLGLREDLLKRRQEIGRLLWEEEEKEGNFDSDERQMDVRYPPGRLPDTRKTHQEGKANRGKAPSFPVE